MLLAAVLLSLVVGTVTLTIATLRLRASKKFVWNSTETSKYDTKGDEASVFWTENYSLFYWPGALNVISGLLVLVLLYKI